MAALGVVKPEINILKEFTALYTTPAARAQNIKKLEEMLRAANIHNSGFTDVGTYGALRASFLVGGKSDEASKPFLKTFEDMVRKMGLDVGYGCKPIKSLKDQAATWLKRAIAAGAVAGGMYYLGSQIWNDSKAASAAAAAAAQQNNGNGAGDGAGDGTDMKSAIVPIAIFGGGGALLCSCVCSVVIYFATQKKY